MSGCSVPSMPELAATHLSDPASSQVLQRHRLGPAEEALDGGAIRLGQPGCRQGHCILCHHSLRRQPRLCKGCCSGGAVRVCLALHGSCRGSSACTPVRGGGKSELEDLKQGRLDCRRILGETAHDRHADQGGLHLHMCLWPWRS